MNTKKSITNFKYKTTNNNEIEENRKSKLNLVLMVTFFTGVLLTISTYAWLSVALNVRVKFFDLSVSSDSGLFISLDGINFSDSIEISANSVTSDLKNTYPNNVNQWSIGGLWPVSSNGIKTRNNDKFDIYVGEINKYRQKEKKNEKFLNTVLTQENAPNVLNTYIAFDFFLKNVSGSPKSDNLYFDEGTYIVFDEETPEDIKEAMSGVINSMRFGVVKISSVPTKTNANIIQNLKCNNNCESIIYEPNYNLHSDLSISKAMEHGVSLVDGEYTPTYAVIKEGNFLKHTNGQIGSGIPLDTEHFSLQNTINELDFEKPIFQIPNAITKMRAYIWLEGQDIDSLEITSKGAPIYIAINFIKDLAGYE